MRMQTTRRKFLEASLGASTFLALGGTMPGFLCRTAKAAGKSQGHKPTLVVIELSGGNDGLNTVIPYEDDAYHRSRPTLRVPPGRVLKLEGGLGLHPDMPVFLRLYREGQLTIVQGVGYPNSDRDHDRAKRDWYSAEPGEMSAQTGWLGRASDCAGGLPMDGVPGVFVGPIRPPFSLHAARSVVPRLTSPEDWLLDPTGRPQTLLSRVSRLAQISRAGDKNQVLDFLQFATVEACAASGRVQAVLETGKNAKDTYPSFPLAQSLKSIARLIRAQLGIRIYYAEQGGGDIGGFDTHAGQAVNHGALLRELSESISAFVSDLQSDGLLDTVLVMTFSEFGRTLTENGRRGTDHGAAAPLFFAGGKLKQRLVGSHPSLTDLDQAAPKFHLDFRRIYATVLDQWLGLNSEQVLGSKFSPLPDLLGQPA